MPASGAIAVHGGAGRWPEALRTRAIEGCRRAAAAGWQHLAEGRSALDAVQAAVAVLEDDPIFNAGRGSVLNAAGEVEMDASLMDGRSGAFGGVGAVQGVLNPVRLARRVLEDGRHLLLVGAGARRFATEAGVPTCAAQDLIVDRQRERWRAGTGTVGCVARAADGGLAAATSTGGTFGKRPGRVGDSALLGCGSYADAVVGVSCTGQGEAIIRSLLAWRVAERHARGMSLQDAAQAALAALAAETAGEAGLIAVDAEGRLVRVSNAPQMPVCRIEADGTAHCDL